ncbi:Hypothetical predicted protein [Paramuricea clavata]|uniref:Uncharacterized protein n=1 Tax=Paramuricea clavata TaxID=317549 RepID=A0A6S7IZT1_PARCT|nr:Hypothetical predicted protein [Paramuricea clavata]
MADIYDGRLWKDFMTINGKDFLKAPRNYGLQLNFDFFQPMKRRKDYSVGVFYLVVLNLPRAERYKWKNVIVIGIVPSFDKEPKNLNPFLEPAVKELQCLWKGMKLKSSKCRFPITFRAAIMSVSADIPAMRKLGGFKSHAALHGCSRCLKSFPRSFGTKPDYSGFCRMQWTPRTNAQHRRKAQCLENIRPSTKKDEFGKKHGITHYSVLLDLEYIDAIRFFTIDPMHNLFLGTAKKMFSLWIETHLLSIKNLEELEKKIQAMDIPNSVGRLPAKISSNYGSYTAEQWKNWTLIYSLVCLKNILPEAHLSCWQTFVLACTYICKPVISVAELEVFDGLFVKFCKEVEALYGKEVITPNMHLHCHLRDVLLDHGPSASFWCFSFERYNGILGSTPTNKRSVELQLMRRFQLSHFLEARDYPNMFQQDLLPLCSQTEKDKSVGWIETTDWQTRMQVDKLAFSRPLPQGKLWGNLSGIFTQENYKLSSLDCDDAALLVEVYKVLYPDLSINANHIGLLIKKFGSVVIGSTKFGSKLEPRSIRSARILASWTKSDGSINKETFCLSPGTVSYYFKHTLDIESEKVTHVFASVKWHKEVPNRDKIGNPVQVWSPKYQEPGCSVFMPVQRTYSHFATSKYGNSRIAVCALLRKSFL